MDHEVNHEVQQESAKDGQLDAGDGVSDSGQEIVRPRQFFLAVSGAQLVNGELGVLAEQVDEDEGEEAADEGDDAEELGS